MKEENLIEQKKEEKIDEIKIDDDFKDFNPNDKWKALGLFFAIGIINHLGIILVITGARILAKELKMDNYLTFYSFSSIIFAFITRLINSNFLLRVAYSKRVFFISIFNVVGYASMFLILLLHNTILSSYHSLCFVLSFIPCLFLGASYAFGESSMIAYLRLFPKTLLGAWSSGTGLSGIIGGFLNFLSQLKGGLSLTFLYLILAPLGVLYYFLFKFTFDILISQDKYKSRKKSNPFMELAPIEGDTEMETEESENKKVDSKDMENTNRGNKSMSIDNFMTVLHNSGEIICNLGFIYLLQFFCVNALLVRVCDKTNIDFLPDGDEGDPHCAKKGKYEFILLFYQIGLFISKSLIKIVRRIRPVELYTIIIFIINILFIIEYYVGFLKWKNYIWISFVVGFLGGAAYAGGFYAILSSDNIEENFKELTVNIASIFNDLGTLASSLLGFLGLKYWLTSADCFE